MNRSRWIGSVLIIFLIPTITWGQGNFPRDTSFTVYSAWIKVVKDFPKATIVKPVATNEVLHMPDQVYRVRQNRVLRMDVFRPTAKGLEKCPAVLMVHGGGWRSGDKSHLLPMAQYLAGNNYVAATVEHHLSVEAIFPAAIYDLKEAVKFLKHNARVYGIDTTKIAVLGCSSGATLASFVAVTMGMDKFEDPESVYPGYSSGVQALVNIDGIVDFTHPAESGKDLDPDKPSAAAMFLGATFKQKPELWQEASPLNYVDQKTPPTLFVNSSIPRFHAGRDSFIHVLNQYGTYNEVHTIDNTPHPFWLFFPWFDQAGAYVLNFLNQVF